MEFKNKPYNYLRVAREDEWKPKTLPKQKEEAKKKIEEIKKNNKVPIYFLKDWRNL